MVGYPVQEGPARGDCPGRDHQHLDAHLVQPGHLSHQGGHALHIQALAPAGQQVAAKLYHDAMVDRLARGLLTGAGGGMGGADVG